MSNLSELINAQKKLSKIDTFTLLSAFAAEMVERRARIERVTLEKPDNKDAERVYQIIVKLSHEAQEAQHQYSLWMSGK